MVNSIPTDYTIMITGFATFYLQGSNEAVAVTVGANNYTRNFGRSHVQAARESKSSNLTSIVMPFQDSSGNLSWDYLGVKREFTIDAIVTGSPDDITRFIWLINQVLNGSQYKNDIHIVYKYGRLYNPATDTLADSAKHIIFKDFIINYEKSSEGRLNYTVTFEEGKRST